MTKLADSIFPIELERIFVLIFRLVLLPSKDLSMDTSCFLICDIGNGFWLMAMVSRPKIGSRCLSLVYVMDPLPFTTLQARSVREFPL